MVLVLTSASNTWGLWRLKYTHTCTCTCLFFTCTCTFIFSVHVGCQFYWPIMWSIFNHVVSYKQHSCNKQRIWLPVRVTVGGISIPIVNKDDYQTWRKGSDYIDITYYYSISIHAYTFVGAELVDTCHVQLQQQHCIYIKIWTHVNMLQPNTEGSSLCDGLRFWYVHRLYNMEVQKGLTSKTNPNLGEAIPVPTQAHLYNTSAKSRATQVQHRGHIHMLLCHDYFRSAPSMRTLNSTHHMPL